MVVALVERTAGECRDGRPGEEGDFEIGCHHDALLIVVFVAAEILSVKCCADLARFADRFPAWFVPSFIVGIAVLSSFGVAMTASM